MDTTVATPSARPSVEATNYLDALRREQERYLDSVAAARTELAGPGHQLNHLSAVQLRLTRQFFDAQRTMLQRRADVDAEVAAIAAETEAHARTVLASAVVRSATPAFEPPAAAGMVSAAQPVDVIAAGTRRAIVSLAEFDSTAKADADALAGIVDEAFVRAESDGARMERQLALLLDEWWAAERQEAGALVDDARARAAVRLHAAHLEACQIDRPAAGDPTPAPLPAAVLDVLDQATTGLDSVLGALTTALSGPVRPAPVAAGVEHAHAHVPGPGTPLAPPAPQVDEAWPAGEPGAIGEAGQDRFLEFWHRELPPEQRGTRSARLRSMLTRVVIPVGAFTTVLALAMAVIG